MLWSVHIHSIMRLVNIWSWVWEHCLNELYVVLPWIIPPLNLRRPFTGKRSPIIHVPHHAKRCRHYLQEVLLPVPVRDFLNNRAGPSFKHFSLYQHHETPVYLSVRSFDVQVRVYQRPVVVFGLYFFSIAKLRTHLDRMYNEEWSNCSQLTAAQCCPRPALYPRQYCEGNRTICTAITTAECAGTSCNGLHICTCFQKRLLCTLEKFAQLQVQPVISKYPSFFWTISSTCHERRY